MEMCEGRQWKFMTKCCEQLKVMDNAAATHDTRTRPKIGPRFILRYSFALYNHLHASIISTVATVG